MKRLILFFCLGCGWTFLPAQDQVSPTIVTDRPSVTASSKTIPVRGLQFESGLLVDRFKSGADNQVDLFSAPNLQIRWGVFERLEFQVYNTYLATEIKTETRSDETNTGLSNLVLGSKVYVFEEAGWRPEMAFQLQIIFPTGGEVAALNHVVYVPVIAFTRSLGKASALSANLGWRNLRKNDSGDLTYSLMFASAITQKWGYFAELHGFWANFEAAYLGIDGGIAWQPRPHYQFDLTVGTSLNYNQYFVSLGFSLLLADLY